MNEKTVADFHVGMRVRAWGREETVVSVGEKQVLVTRQDYPGHNSRFGNFWPATNLAHLEVLEVTCAQLK